MVDYSRLFSAPDVPGRHFTEPADINAGSSPKAQEDAPGEATDTAEEVPLDNVAGWIREKQTGKPISVELERLQSTAARYREGYKAYQDNIKRAGTLREQITKGARAGAEPADLLLLAVECIAAMTGEAYFLDNFKAITTEMR